MATYGSRDKNPFQAPETFLLNGVSTPSNLGKTRYYLLVEADGPNKGQITIKSPTVAGNIGGANADRTVGVIPLDNSFRPTPGNATTEEVKYFSSVAGQKSVKNHAIITAQKAGAAQPTAQQLVVPNSANPDSTDGTGSPNSAGIGNTDTGISKENYDILKGEVNKKYVKGTRIEYYGDVKYPEKLNLNNQDCIKFTIVEYTPRTLNIQLNQKRRTSLDGKKSLGTITLPIPAGIDDRNSVNWGEDRMNVLEAGAADLAMNFILGGVGAATNSAQSSMQSIMGTDNKTIEAFIASKATEKAVGSNNLISRQFGASVNDNLELLFNGPQLRDFTFNFRFTPREKKEAENIKKIIRFFKQAMAPKRTESVLLLRAPHTFSIQYLSKNENHPYLNRFKECALTNCAVSYTPDGTYMTYTDSSMTAYELSLTFQELEAVFDDDYGLLDDNTDKFIGY